MKENTAEETQKRDVYQIVTDKILETMERGEVPWHKPWKSMSSLPVNLKTKRRYSGLNVWMLVAEAFAKGYTSPYWLTFNQVKSLGGHVRKGEKSTLVVFWKWIEYEEEVENPGEIETKPRKRPFLRYYSVFNTDQCEGLDEKLPKIEKNEEISAIDSCEKIAKEMPKCPVIVPNGGRAYYNPREDKIGMPKAELFESSEEYYSTLFHEMGHSTGHESRVGRKSITEGFDFWGDHKYSQEELVAEFAAAYLCAFGGIENKTIDNSAAYIQHWKKAFKEDKRLVVIAASQGQKAADYILGRRVEKEGE